MLGLILTILGLVTAVGGPVLAALLANPVVAAHANLVSVLGVIGIIITLAGVAHDALLKWQASNQVHLQAMAKLAQPAPKP